MDDPRAPFEIDSVTIDGGGCIVVVCRARTSLNTSTLHIHAGTCPDLDDWIESLPIVISAAVARAAHAVTGHPPDG